LEVEQLASVGREGGRRLSRECSMRSAELEVVQVDPVLVALGIVWDVYYLDRLGMVKLPRRNM